jgi:PKD repeat protein
MKRFRPVLIAVFGALLLLAIGSTAAARTVPEPGNAKVRVTSAASGEFVSNGSFESSLAGWSGYRATLTRVTGGVDGTYAARVALSGSTTSGGFSIVPNSAPVSSTSAGTTYTASAAVKTSRSDLMVCNRIRVYDAGGAQIDNVTTCLNGAANWTTFAPLKYAATVAGRRLDSYVYAWNVRKGDFFSVDAVSLVAGDVAPANVAPTASFTASPIAPSSGSAVAFDASASRDSDGTIASYAWSFGDGTTGSGRSASHAYAQPGTYMVSLTVTDDRNATNTTSSPLVVSTVSPAVNQAPVTRAAVSPLSAATGETVSVNGSSSTDADGTIASYAWDFGDGASATGATASHAYAAAGTFTVRLTVTDDKGATGSATQSVTVTAPAPPPPSTGLVAAPVDNAHVALSWAPVAGAAKYRVSRGTLVVGTTSLTTFTDAMLWPSTSYSFSVQPLNASGTVLSTLTASASTKALPASGFQRPFPDSSVWNSPIGSTPVRSDSAALAASVAGSAGSANMPLRAWAVSVAEARPGDTTYSVPCTLYACSLQAFGAFPVPATAKPDPSSDGHLAVYDPSTQREWDMWVASFNGSSWSSYAGAAVSMNGNGIAPAGSASGNAANFPLLGGLIRPEEIMQGHIDHALVFGFPGVNRSGYVCPATHNDGSGTSGPMEGQRFQLDPSLDVNSLAIPAWQKTIARAMQVYGLYLRDTSGSLAVYAENTISRGYDAWALAGLPTGGSVSLSGLPWNKLRAVSAPC